MMGKRHHVLRAHLMKFRTMLIQCRKKQQLIQRDFVQGAFISMEIRQFARHAQPDR